MKIDLNSLTIQIAHDAIKAGEYSARDLANAYLEQIENKNKDLNIYIEVFSDVLEQADRADEMFRSGSATLLTGIPIALKDNMLISGKSATCGSQILSGYVASYDSTVAKTLKENGAVILGRTNMDEFAMGSSSETSFYGVPKNPYYTSRVPGGSSGGSSAAVAANMALATLGSDTGGSIRQPAAFCGVVGLKPTYSTISRYGIIALASSLDQVGPFTRNVDDTKILFDTLSVPDKSEATSISAENRKFNFANTKKIGIPRDFLTGLNPEVERNFNESIEHLKSLGYEIVDVSLPLIKYSLAVYYIIQPAEASSNLARFDGVRYGLRSEGKNLEEVYSKTRGTGFGKETRRRILLGTYVLSHGYYDAYYNKALLLQKEITNELKNIFKSVDFIFTPTTATGAFKIGEKSDPVSMYLSDIFTVPANIAGTPAISVPSGFTSEGLPIGMQFMGAHFSEQELFEVAKKFEDKTGFNRPVLE
jgi:aspartyl-tRNA(Asn)/glutamyl-tRNA(Gln) amidotransferase subunit A